MDELDLNALIGKINQLARKSRAEGLTAEEQAEQAALRAKYVELFRNSLKAQLDNTVILRPDGTAEKLKQKNAGN